MSELLNRDEVNSQELEELLKAREAGEADFLLVDVREPGLSMIWGILRV